jgi:type I restriction enzyme R subunit
MALFINANKSVTLQGIKLHLFYTDDSVIHNNSLFAQNIFSVVQELPYKTNIKANRSSPSVLISASSSTASISATAN